MDIKKILEDQIQAIIDRIKDCPPHYHEEYLQLHQQLERYIHLYLSHFYSGK